MTQKKGTILELIPSLSETCRIQYAFLFPLMKSFKYFDLVMAAFVAVLLISNVASSAKIIDWGVSPFGLRLAFDAGTLLFPLSYIFGDILTEVYGYARARRVIWTGFLWSAFMALC